MVSVNGAFSDFASNLEISDYQVNLISSRRANAISCLRGLLVINNDLLIGSYDRHTMIRPLSQNDVDVLVVLNYAAHFSWHNQDGTRKALDAFRNILSASPIYRQTEMRRDRNCITLKFSEFHLDLVPAFDLAGGRYAIPDSVQSVWLDTNPLRFASAITMLNHLHSGLFVPLVKMIKAWNRNNGSLLKSFHVECLLYNYFSYSPAITSFADGCRRFMSSLPSLLQSYCTEPIFGQIVDNYLDENSSTFISKRRQAIAMAQNVSMKADQAYACEVLGSTWRALDIWKQIFGDYFPASADFIARRLW